MRRFTIQRQKHIFGRLSECVSENTLCHCLSCDEDKYVWAWGKNEYGQLGNNETGGREEEPVQVLKGEMSWADTYLEDIVDIDAGIDHSIAVDDANGHVWAWGCNYSDELGDGGASGIDSEEPVCVLDGNMPGCSSGKLEGIIDVAVCCGSNLDGSSYALEDEDGNVWSWGSDDYGKLGDGRATNQVKDEPVEVKDVGGSGTLSNIIAISAGDEHVLALEALEQGGKVYAWGRNKYGQLGNGKSGENEKETSPIVVQKNPGTPTDLTNIVYIDAGFNHSMAMDKDGNIWVWGYNFYGQLGLNDKTQRNYATPLE